MYLQVIRCLLVFWLAFNFSNGDKLSPGQRPPPGAIASGGIALTAPLQGNAADVGKRLDVGRSGGVPQSLPKPSKPLAPVPADDGVIREETEELKEVNGELVRVVKGNFGYDSPEGLPVAVKYQADENGNRASFTIGNPGGGASGGGRPSGGGKKPGGLPRPGGAGGGAGGGGGRPGGDSTYLPPTKMNPDRSYLPPS